jgi:hypothetical protein
MDCRHTRGGGSGAAGGVRALVVHVRAVDVFVGRTVPNEGSSGGLGSLGLGLVKAVCDGWGC